MPQPYHHAGGGRSGPSGQRPGGGAPARGNGPEPEAANAEFQTLLGKICLADPTPDLFDTTAQGIAKTLRPSARHGPNKRSQVRRFYDELMRYRLRLGISEQSDGNADAFRNVLPFIRMLNAKAAYARGRELVDDEFVKFIRAIVGQIREDQPQTLLHACTLFEAVIGFMPPDRG